LITPNRNTSHLEIIIILKLISMANKQIIRILTQNGLKITPQRIAVMEVLILLKNHPTAENIIEYLRVSHPNIAMGTVYNILETFVKKGLLNKVKTGKHKMRFDSVILKHHHLYCNDSERIEDYVDPELDKIIEKYLKNKKIPDFEIIDIRLQIMGKFTDKVKTLNIQVEKQF
jgi:Fur family transcriptional regulator, peroxide stress response regulator